MKSKPVISQELFEEMLEDAIGDLQNSGMNNEQVFVLIKDLFGPHYASKFCRN